MVMELGGRGGGRLMNTWNPSPAAPPHPPPPPPPRGHKMSEGARCIIREMIGNWGAGGGVGGDKANAFVVFSSN